MFNLIINKKPKLNFNTNKLIVKIHREQLDQKAISAKAQMTSKQTVEPEEASLGEALFEIY
jgi:hypothetical protein